MIKVYLNGVPLYENLDDYHIEKNGEVFLHFIPDASAVVQILKVDDNDPTHFLEKTVVNAHSLIIDKRLV